MQITPLIPESHVLKGSVSLFKDFPMWESPEIITDFLCPCHKWKRHQEYIFSKARDHTSD